MTFPVLKNEDRLKLRAPDEYLAPFDQGEENAAIDDATEQARDDEMTDDEERRRA